MNLNILSLGSYDVLVGMDWLEKHKSMVNFLDKKFHYIYIYVEGRPVIVKGKPRPITVKEILAL